MDTQDNFMLDDLTPDEKQYILLQAQGQMIDKRKAYFLVLWAEMNKIVEIIYVITYNGKPSELEKATIRLEEVRQNLNLFCSSYSTMAHRLNKTRNAEK